MTTPIRCLLLVLASVVVLTACTSDDPIAQPTTEPVTDTESEDPTEAKTSAPGETEDPEEEARAEIEAVYGAYTEAFTTALEEGPTPEVLIERLDGIATVDWISKLSQGFGVEPDPITDPAPFGPVTIVEVDLEAGTASGTYCWDGEQGDLRVARNERTRWLVDQAATPPEPEPCDD